MTLKVKNIYYLKSCTKATGFPEFNYPEFAFFGRSNVGKSSLINMMMGKKDLVKTGARPGVTRMINFFILNDSISLVDMPGYGYAKLPKELTKTFLPMMKSYISKRKNIKAAFVLIDIRRRPGEFEHSILTELAKNKIPVALTVTKCDKISKNQRLQNLKAIEEELGISRDFIFFSSSKTGEGKKELLKIIADHVRSPSSLNTLK